MSQRERKRENSYWAWIQPGWQALVLNWENKMSSSFWQHVYWTHLTATTVNTFLFFTCNIFFKRMFVWCWVWNVVCEKNRLKNRHEEANWQESRAGSLLYAHYTSTIDFNLTARLCFNLINKTACLSRIPFFFLE